MPRVVRPERPWPWPHYAVGPRRRRSGPGVDPAQVGVVGAVGVAVHGGEAVAHAGPAGPAVLQAEDVAELVAGGLAPGGGVGQVAGVEVQAAIPGGVGPGVVI